MSSSLLISHSSRRETSTNIVHLSVACALVYSSRAVTDISLCYVTNHSCVNTVLQLFRLFSVFLVVFLLLVFSQGRVYFYHAPTGVTQWHPPAPVPAHNAQPPRNFAPYSGGYQEPTHAIPCAAPANSPPVHHGPPPSGYPNASGNVASSQMEQSSLPAASPSTHAMPANASAFVFDRQMEFKLQEKYFSLSGDSFKILDVASGAPVFMMKGKIASIIRERKTLCTSDGRPLYSLTEAALSLRGRMFITDASTKQPVLCLRKKGFIPMMGTSTVQAWHGGSDEGTPYIEIKGNLLRKSFNVTECATGRTIASVKRKSNLKSLILEKDSYICCVEPGIDAALMVTLTVALDEHYRDDGNKSGISGIVF